VLEGADGQIRATENTKTQVLIQMADLSSISVCSSKVWECKWHFRSGFSLYARKLCGQNWV